MKSAIALSFAAAAVALPASGGSFTSSVNLCPTDNTTVQSNNFQYYNLQCSKWIAVGSEPIRTVESTNGYQVCLTACDGTVGCAAVEYEATNFNQSSGICRVYNSSNAEVLDGPTNSWTVALPIGWNGTTPGTPNGPEPTTTEVATAEPTRFYGIAIHSGSDIQYASVNANGLQFALNKDTATYCPSSVVSSCPNTTSTIFLHGVNSTTLSLDVSVPGGQQVYVAQGGVLSFTQAHSASTGNGSVTTGFAINADNHLQFEEKDFLACPVTDGSYEVRASSRIIGEDAAQDCLGFAFRVQEVTTDVQSVWQYV